MLKELPEEEFGPGIDFREYSILDNPSLPQEVYWNELHLISKPLRVSLFLFRCNLLKGNLFAWFWISDKKVLA